MADEKILNIRYYRWEGDACRLIEYENGVVAADLYRAGKGNILINKSDIICDGVPISEEKYKELVLEEIALNKNKN